MRKKFKISAIVQTRIGSTRLPGKVLADISEKPMVWHVVDRLKHSKKLNDIILAVPDTKENDELERFAKENNLKYFRGSEEDVLSRYYGAAKKFNSDLIARITSDCPLIDPKIVDLVIEKHLESGADYTSNVLKRTFPRGLETEIFNFKSLERAHKEAKEAYQREHVTIYIYEHPEIFNLQNVEAKDELRKPELRLTLDTKEDLAFIKAIYDNLYKPSEIFHTKDVMILLKNHPEFLKINRGIKQKRIGE